MAMKIDAVDPVKGFMLILKTLVAKEVLTQEEGQTIFDESQIQ